MPRAGITVVGFTTIVLAGKLVPAIRFMVPCP
ncbi:Uncharacterised protein [Vibrio cholerae]|nr:Uncharacterised protein [Vibrio cholerae]